MARALDAEFVEKYARGPSKETTDAAIAAHKNIRDLLGDTSYATVLQGSYKNDTALWDINDVDIVAVDRAVRSGVSHWDWSAVFARIEAKLQLRRDYAGKWSRGDKCIRVNLPAMRVDIVPAARTADATSDPIAIYSFAKGREKLNWPRMHCEHAAAKSGRTNGAFKRSVRLFKRYVRCWFKGTKVAPSYYIECLVHSSPDSEFSGDLAADFERIGSRIVALDHVRHRLPRIAGEGDLFSSEEWTREDFVSFQRQLTASLVRVREALAATDQGRARAAWIAAFNGFTG